MSRHIEKSSFGLGVPHTPEQLLICEQVKRIFGLKPESVHLRKAVCGLRESCVVVRVGRRRTVQFTLVGGVLVGIFQKKRGQP
jgi:hypothetical protein